MFSKWLIGNNCNRMRNSYIWNSISGFLNALQSTIILFVIQRVATEEESGIFTIVFATANLMLAIGKYGVRYYQAADISKEFSYNDYFTHRIYTSGIMTAATVIFCIFSLFFGGYSREKALFCLFLCLQKVVDSVEDVIHGEYHRNDYLDLAGRSMTLRLIITLLSFIIPFIFTKSLLYSAIASLVASALALFVLTVLAQSRFEKPSVNNNAAKSKKLFIKCLPLFTTSFLSLFIVNAPKYAIDILMDESAQAIYGFVSLPVFVVALLSECLFRPMITSFSQQWMDKNFTVFLKKILKVSGGIFLLTIFCTVFGVILGVPVLSIFFNTELKDYWLCVGILLFGGGFLSLTSFLNVILTVIGKTNSIAFAHLVASIAALPISLLFVKLNGITGAALSYLTVIILLTVSVVAFLTYYLLKEMKRKQP